jgi:hypothetical protein
MQKEMKKKEIEFPIDWELKIGSCMIWWTIIMGNRSCNEVFCLWKGIMKQHAYDGTLRRTICKHDNVPLTLDSLFPWHPNISHAQLVHGRSCSIIVFLYIVIWRPCNTSWHI